MEITLAHLLLFPPRVNYCYQKQNGCIPGILATVIHIDVHVCSRGRSALHRHAAKNKKESKFMDYVTKNLSGVKVGLVDRSEKSTKIQQTRLMPVCHCGYDLRSLNVIC